MPRPDPPLRTRLILTAVLLAALAATTIGPVRERIFERHLFAAADEAAVEVVDQAFTRALAAFALARLTNGVISVIQETEVNATPAGVGVTLSPGEVLDPVNDLVERFSWVMLVALTSLGVQKFLIEVAPWLSIQLLVSLALVVWLADLWLHRLLPVARVGLARRLLLVALVVRFAVPAVAGINHLVYENFLAARYETATAAVEHQTEELRQADPTAALDPARESARLAWWQRLRQALDRAESALDIRRLLDWLQDRAARLIDGFLTLIVVFLLNTVLLPIAFLWGLLRLCRMLVPDSRLTRLETVVRQKLTGGGKPDDQV